jgi:hypothetical protein
VTVRSAFGKYRRFVVKSGNAPVVTGTLLDVSVTVGADAEVSE